MMAQHLKKFGCCKFVALSVFAKWLFSWFLLPWEVSKNSLPLPLIFNWNHYGTNIGFAMEVDLQERSSVALADRWCCLFHGSLSLQFTGTRPWNFARNLISFLEWAEQITHKFIYRLHLFSTSWHVFFPLKLTSHLFTLTSVSNTSLTTTDICAFSRIGRFIVRLVCAYNWYKPFGTPSFIILNIWF